MSGLDRTRSAFDKQGVIAKRKRLVIILAIVAVALASVAIGVGVSVSSKKGGRGKPASPAPTATPPVAAPVQASSASTRPIVREARLNGKVDSQLLRDFLEALTKRVNKIPGMQFVWPSLLPASFNTLLMYIRDMSIEDLYQPLLDYAETLDINSLSVDDIPAIVKAAQKMFTTAALEEWGRFQAVLHEKLAGNQTAVSPAELRDMALKANRTMPQLSVQREALHTYMNYIASNTSVPTKSAPAKGRRLAGAGSMGRKLAAGEAEFADLCIPVVFHVLQYKQQSRTAGAETFPGTGRTPDAQNLIDHMNYLFRNEELTTYFQTPATPTKLQFRLKAVEDSPTTAPYLDVTEDEWAACAMNFPLMDRVATAAYDSYPPTQYLNVIVCGDAPKNGSGMAGYAFVPSGPVEDYQETGNPWRPGGSRYIFIRTSEFLSTGFNNNDSFQRGAYILAHEVGHHLGLFHPHAEEDKGAPPCSDGDALVDTPTTQVVNKAAYYTDLVAMCDSWRLNGGIWPTGPGQKGYTLGTMSTCPANNTIDPVFNVMEYVPSSCASHFSPEQVAYLQTAIPAYRPKLYASAAGKCPTAGTSA